MDFPTYEPRARATELPRIDATDELFQRLLGQKPQACLKLLMNIVSDFGRTLQDNRDQLKSLLRK